MRGCLYFDNSRDMCIICSHFCWRKTRLQRPSLCSLALAYKSWNKLAICQLNVCDFCRPFRKPYNQELKWCGDSHSTQQLLLQPLSAGRGGDAASPWAAAQTPPVLIPTAVGPLCMHGCAAHLQLVWYRAEQLSQSWLRHCAELKTGCFVSICVLAFPQMSSPNKWERTAGADELSVPKRLFLSFEGITCLLLHLHKGSLFFSIYSKWHSCMWTLCSHFPSNTKQNYLHCHSSLSFSPITKNWCKSIFVWSGLCWQQLILKPQHKDIQESHMFLIYKQVIQLF